MNTWKDRWGEKGFTMAELLIVVAIIAVLAAVAIPIFTNQLEKSREGADADTIRNAYAKAAVVALEGHNVTSADTDKELREGLIKTCTKEEGTGDVIVTTDKVSISQDDENSWITAPIEIAETTINDKSAIAKTASGECYLQFKFDKFGKLQDVTSSTSATFHENVKIVASSNGGPTNSQGTTS